MDSQRSRLRTGGCYSSGLGRGLERDFECARKTLWTEQEFGPAELTRECSLYEVGSEALLFWRTNLWTPALLPNEFNSIRLTVPLPGDAHAPATVRQRAVFDGIGRKFM